jgi:hypothetical protein
MQRIINTNLIKLLSFSGVFWLTIGVSGAYENIGKKPESTLPPRLLGKAAGCQAATAKRDLDVNNVRTTILNGGDMWWNLNNARYEVPKVEANQVAKNSLFSGALWIGGVTNGNIRIAAQTYRQSGNDFFPGPLSNGTAFIDEAGCKKYDRIWKISLSEIDAFRKSEALWADPSEEIVSWPCEGDVDKGEAKYIAPFFDNDNDGRYDPTAGDYPSFDQNNDKNIPDMMLFILFNDKGNIHTESQGLQIGLELQTHAFAYSTNDEINNMTFYRTVIYNRGNEEIDSCVFGQWVDPDLGNYNDDYVECDVKRNLGICYNGDDNDEGILGYGLNPPSVGVNFFEGPRRPDGTEIGLTKFVYYNNDFTNFGNPTKPEHYWGYLNGKWKDGTSITYGGNGKGGADTASFMFPGSTDPAGRPAWTERNSQNQPADRRFLQTAGAFSLLPGAVNKVTIGVVWARASSGGATGSFNLLKEASDKAFILFKNNFNLITGPEAPQLAITELNRGIVIQLTNTQTVENFADSFAGPCDPIKTQYRFQGYQVFQLKIPNIPSDIYDTEQARLVAQFDVKDGNARLVNSVFSPELEENVKKIMVTGADAGIQHSFQINRDLFETGSDQTLVNFKNYYYVIISYAAATNCSTDPIQYLPGRKTVGRDALVVYTVTPHDPSQLNNGTQVNAEYGDGLTITQIEGIGNGGVAVELSSSTIQEIMKSPNAYAKNRTFVPGKGPISVKVVDPLKLPQGKFILYLRDTANSSTKDDTLSAPSTSWYISHNGIVKRGTYTIAKPNEQLFPEWGISVQLSQSMLPGDADNLEDQSNGYISSTITWSNNTQKWLANVVDEDPLYSNVQYQGGTLAPQFNWIRSGNGGTPAFDKPEINDFAFGAAPNAVPLDPRKNFGKIVDGAWSTYALASRWRKLGADSVVKMPTFGPAWDEGSSVGFGPGPGPGGASTLNLLSELYSVKIVYTPDKSLWSRCVVLEAGEKPTFNIGGADKMDMRKSPSVDKNGKPGDGIVTNDPNDADYISATGMGWFPGYAIKHETGERLNILFAEDSSLPGENGTDMIWNPTSRIFANSITPVFGGKHYVYVMDKKGVFSGSTRYEGVRYDAGASYASKLVDPSVSSPTPYIVRKRQVFSQAMWVSMPLLDPQFKLLSPASGLVPSQVVININVKRPYASYSIDGSTLNDSMPYFTFNTEGFAPTTSTDIGRKALDNVNIVPNPYYAYSSYEDPGNQLDNRVRLVNLPGRCEIRVFTLEGTLVRIIRKDDPSAPYTEWDLKNDAKVPISSGTYLIHIKALDFGEERIIKWFGVMRPVDFDTF